MRCRPARVRCGGNGSGPDAAESAMANESNRNMWAGYLFPLAGLLIFVAGNRLAGQTNIPAGLFHSGAMFMPDQVPGLSLRDYFAAKAMEGIVSSGLIACRSDQFEKLAKLAYDTADAMLKQRDEDRSKPENQAKIGVA